MAVEDPPNWFGRFLLLSGFIFLLHSGYSAIEHLAYLKSISKQESWLPIDILLECILSLGLCILASVMVSGTLRPIQLEAELSKKPMDHLDHLSSFRTMHHRGKVLFKSS
ncbi:hypothetical protein SmJEL517_g03454 [Synchytrium microbalum]|uniref:Membrane magnesium transporter n=1 Tax=Synchytrium microbalum TaxID=1806994 RepID=A0A507BWN8_9FUNG|nr:uncharacterized protein SmJEL517_g03454 [Synchytrium microbalum]TPX33760.1 hypothetical protein SmJEL517_g03454 [Synchytrium microbalum]